MANRGMGRNASSVGMMEGAFFVSRTELLEWVNRLLAVKLTKVEQCASGAIYCQIVDACNPGTVKMAKVNWMARAEHEFIPNYKILQAAFDRNNIQKHVDVDKLIRAKYQDNLEFLQWMKAMWDREGAGIRDYDPVKAREGRPLPAWASDPVEKENLSANRKHVTSDKVEPSTRRAAPTAGNKAAPQQRAITPRAGYKPQALELEVESLKQQLSAQIEETEDLRETVDKLHGIEQERDYYFRKLRKVEILCGTLDAKMDPNLDVAGMISQVQGILFCDDSDEEEREEATATIPPAEAPLNSNAVTEPELPTLNVDQAVAEGIKVG